MCSVTGLPACDAVVMGYLPGHDRALWHFGEDAAQLWSAMYITYVNRRGWRQMLYHGHRWRVLNLPQAYRQCDEKDDLDDLDHPWLNIGYVCKPGDHVFRMGGVHIVVSGQSTAWIYSARSRDQYAITVTRLPATVRTMHGCGDMGMEWTANSYTKWYDDPDEGDTIYLDERSRTGCISEIWNRETCTATGAHPPPDLSQLPWPSPEWFSSFWVEN